MQCMCIEEKTCRRVLFFLLENIFKVILMLNVDSVLEEEGIEEEGIEGRHK